MTPVGSYDEWTRLEEIVVGTPYAVDYRRDSAFAREFLHDYEPTRWYAVPESPVFRTRPSDRLQEELDEDLDGLVGALEGEGVRVRRPTMLTEVPVVATAGWSAPMSHALVCRDNTLIVGDEIIETPPATRARYLEGDLLKELFTEYFLAGARWTAAPRSRLLDRNLDYSVRLELGYSGDVPSDPCYEIVFEAAQCVRLGRDILFNSSTRNHRLGARWLKRHLGEEFEVHEVRVAANHIDATLMPLRPGTLLAGASMDAAALPEKFRGWDIIRYERHDVPLEIADRGNVRQVSQTVGLNVLSIDEDKVLVQDIQRPLIRDLERAGFTPVPVRWRHGRCVGGGLHCVTLDVRRRGGLESYA